MKIKRPYSLDRIARFSLVLNFAEIAVLAAISAVLLEPHFSLQNALLRPVAIISCFMLMINNIINIRIGRHWTDADAQYDMVKDALGHVERLNVELRTQRHDFMNHLQVVYSLVEMDDCPSATEYIDKILGNASFEYRAFRKQQSARLCCGAERCGKYMY